MKILALAAALLFAIAGCNKEKGEVICSSAEFVFLNQAGDDIFNANTPNHIEIADFILLTPDNNVELNYYSAILNGKNHFQIGINGLAAKEGTTYFKFGNITTDTIYAKFREVGNSQFISELYYNGKLIESNESVGECGGAKVYEITVVKE